LFIIIFTNNNSPWTNLQTNLQKVSPQTPFPELGFKTLEQTYSQHDIEFCPPTPPFPELGFKTLEQTYQHVSIYLHAGTKLFPGENSATDLGLFCPLRYLFLVLLYY